MRKCPTCRSPRTEFKERIAEGIEKRFCLDCFAVFTIYYCSDSFSDLRKVERDKFLPTPQQLRGGKK